MIKCSSLEARYELYHRVSLYHFELLKNSPLQFYLMKGILELSSELSSEFALQNRGWTYDF
jgi:hypothetical protein